MIMELDDYDLKVLDKVGDINSTYYTEEESGRTITKDNLISCIEDLLAEIEHLNERIEQLEEGE